MHWVSISATSPLFPHTTCKYRDVNGIRQTNRLSALKSKNRSPQTKFELVSAVSPVLIWHCLNHVHTVCIDVHSLNDGLLERHLLESTTAVTCSLLNRPPIHHFSSSIARRKVSLRTAGKPATSASTPHGQLASILLID